MRKVVILAAVVLWVGSGCVVMPSPPRSVSYDVEVISEPLGARIEVNNDYVGDAPLTVEMFGGQDGRVTRQYVIKAYPVNVGWTQTKKLYFSYGNIGRHLCDFVPKRMLFNTNLEPINPTDNVNLNIKNQK